MSLLSDVCEREVHPFKLLMGNMGPPTVFIHHAGVRASSDHPRLHVELSVTATDTDGRPVCSNVPVV